MAQGKYTAFWDDDNLYDDHVLATAYASAFEYDVGVVQVIYQGVLVIYGGRRFARLSGRWDERVRCGEVDIMCVCVRTEVVRRVRWAGTDPRLNDFYWLDRLTERGAQVRFMPALIGY